MTSKKIYITLISAGVTALTTALSCAGDDVHKAVQDVQSRLPAPYRHPLIQESTSTSQSVLAQIRPVPHPPFPTPGAPKPPTPPRHTRYDGKDLADASQCVGTLRPPYERCKRVREILLPPTRLT